MASIKSSLTMPSLMTFSCAPLKRTPWGITVAMIPSSFKLAIMCCRNIRSPFFPVSGVKPYLNLSG